MVVRLEWDIGHEYLWKSPSTQLGQQIMKYMAEHDVELSLSSTAYWLYTPSETQNMVNSWSTYADYGIPIWAWIEDAMTDTPRSQPGLVTGKHGPLGSPGAWQAGTAWEVSDYEAIYGGGMNVLESCEYIQGYGWEMGLDNGYTWMRNRTSRPISVMICQPWSGWGEYWDYAYYPWHLDRIDEIIVECWQTADQPWAQAVFSQIVSYGYQNSKRIGIQTRFGPQSPDEAYPQPSDPGHYGYVKLANTPDFWSGDYFPWAQYLTPMGGLWPLYKQSYDTQHNAAQSYAANCAANLGRRLDIFKVYACDPTYYGHSIIEQIQWGESLINSGPLEWNTTYNFAWTKQSGISPAFGTTTNHVNFWNRLRNTGNEIIVVKNVASSPQYTNYWVGVQPHTGGNIDKFYATIPLNRYAFFGPFPVASYGHAVNFYFPDTTSCKFSVIKHNQYPYQW